MHIFNKTDDYNNLLKRGTIIWRQCGFKVVGIHRSMMAELREVKFEETAKGTWMARVHIHGDFTDEPAVHSSGFPGIIVFTDTKPEDSFTHLIVDRVSKAGKAIFASAAKPYDMEDYLQFRSRLASAHAYNLNSAFDERVKIAMGIQTNELRTNERRLISMPIHGPRDKDALYHYCHLRRMLTVQKSA